MKIKNKQRSSVLMKWLPVMGSRLVRAFYDAGGVPQFGLGHGYVTWVDRYTKFHQTIYVNCVLIESQLYFSENERHFKKG